MEENEAMKNWMRNGELLLCNTMESIRESLGTREYETVFQANVDLDYEKREDNYVFRATNVD